MTDNTMITPNKTQLIIKNRLKARYAAERGFKFFGMAMVTLAVLAAATLMISIFVQALPAFSESRLIIDYPLPKERIDPTNSGQKYMIRSQGDFSGLIVDAVKKQFQNPDGDNLTIYIKKLVGTMAIAPVAKKVANHPQLIGKTIKADFALDNDIDMFLKGGFGKVENIDITNNISNITKLNGNIFQFSATENIFASIVTKLQNKINDRIQHTKIIISNKNARLNDVETQLKAINKPNMANPKYLELDNTRATLTKEIQNAKNELSMLSKGSNYIILNDNLPSIIIYAAGGAYKINQISNSEAFVTQIISPSKDIAALPTKKINATASYLAMPQDGRPINDTMIAVTTILQNNGLIKQRPNFTLLTRSDSNDAEMAGLLSAMVGSLLTLLVTFTITVPVGVLAAIYLEEFAPKNAITDIIEVNINNLAAVPSIVYGLLGFSIFLHFFGMPRSAPIVGGIVLALMSLPVIIIASRASLKAVPPSIREAALGVGASKVQAIFHHVLPLAVPGLMTGAILAMAHALGETAPLLMIGMVAFIADLPNSFSDASTVLPVEIFMWAGRPERAWDARTSAAIIILLLFMVIMNLAAIYVRRKFERRW